MTFLLKVSEMKMMFPNLHKLAAIGFLIPMSSVDDERGFSTLQEMSETIRPALSSKAIGDSSVLPRIFCKSRGLRV